MIRRTTKIVAVALTGVAATAVAAGGLLAWRLSQGPIELDPLIPYIEQALSDSDGRFRVDIGELVLSLEDERGLDGRSSGGARRLDLRARRVQALNAEGGELAAVPEMGIGLSIPALLRGTLSPTRLDLVRPRLTVLRRADGSLAFDVRADGNATARRSETEPDPLEEVLASLRQPPAIDRPLGLLRRLSVLGADLTVENRMLDLSWHAKRADVILDRDALGTQAQARLTLDLARGGTDPARPGSQADVTVAATGRYDNAAGTSELSLAVDGLEPAALSRIGPAMAPLAAVRLPLSGTVTARLDQRFDPSWLTVDLRGGTGTLDLPQLRPEPVDVRGLDLRGSLDVAARRLAVESLSLRALGPDPASPVALTAKGELTEDGDGRRHARADLSLTAGGQTAGLSLSGEQAAGGGGRAAARLAEVVPSALAALAAALVRLPAAALPLSGTLDVAFDPSLQPTGGRADLTAGRGLLRLPAQFEAPVPVASASLRLQGDRDLVRLDGLSLVLGDDGGPQPRVEATATARRQGDGMAVEAQATARGVPVDGLRRYWPVTAGPNAREWVTSNLSHGTVTEARAEVALTVPVASPVKPELTRFGASIAGEDVTVRYFHDLTPVTGAGVEAATDGKTFTITTKGGRIPNPKSGDIELGAGKVVIGGLDVGKETMDIRLPVQGPVRSILTLIDMPPLGYPTKLEMDPARTQGTAEAQLHFAFPLLVDLKTEQLDLEVAGKLHKVGVEKVAAGLTATEGELSLALDLKAMEIKGNAKLDGIPVAIEWKESFDSAAKGPRTRIAVKGEAGADDLRAHGIDLEDRVQGPFGADVLFTVDRRHKLLLTAGLNLEKTRLSIDELAWRKPAGRPGTGKLTLEFDKDRPARISNLTVDAGDLHAVANLELADGGKRVARVQAPVFKLGETDLRADVTVLPPAAPGGPAGGYSGTIAGTSLDARGLTGKAQPDAPPGAAKPPPKVEAGDGRKTPLDLAIKFDSVVFGEGRRLRQVAGTMRRNSTAWTLLDLAGRSGIPGDAGSGVSLSWRPGAQGQFDLAITADDLGAALRSMDLNDRMRGGRLRLTGRSVEPRPDAAIAGKAEIRDYTLIDVPALARILNAISPSGFAELLGGGKGVNFGRMSAEFRKEGRLLTLKDLRTSGSALGLTLEGQIDLETDTANLKGTIVPIYGLNRLIGQIPLLGDALSGGEGQGIFSATWHVQGPLSNPDVSVNPLAVLAPGFLRNLFFLGGDGVAAPDTAPPPESHMR
ncbi:AsmA-like C-terminal domain-containing protein [Azospirillum picis]|uniref:YhdP family protein n=1 Tax=Azospirillum picis TaxID=488438 RepID=UPI0036106FD2